MDEIHASPIHEFAHNLTISLANLSVTFSSEKKSRENASSLSSRPHFHLLHKKHQLLEKVCCMSK